jgi:hypothetical protein
MTQTNGSETAAAITTILENLPSKLGRGRTNLTWTRQIMDEIGAFGIENEWEVCTAGFPDRFHGGWLYDLVWFRNDPTGHLADVGLVLESEWGGVPEIKYDFEKLLLAKADLKVMVFQADDRSTATLLDYLEKAIRTFREKNASEIYVLAAFNNSSFKFDFRQKPAI